MNITQDLQSLDQAFVFYSLPLSAWMMIKLWTFIGRKDLNLPILLPLLHRLGVGEKEEEVEQIQDKLEGVV